jgi:hypothetical protein
MRETDIADDTLGDLRNATARNAITLGERAVGLVLQREHELARAKEARDDARNAAILAFEQAGMNPTRIAEAMRRVADATAQPTAGLSNNNIRVLLALLGQRGPAHDRATRVLEQLANPPQEPA